MSMLGELLDRVRRALILEERVEVMSRKLDALEAREADTRERMIRIEGIITGASMATSARKRLR